LGRIALVALRHRARDSPALAASKIPHVNGRNAALTVDGFESQADRRGKGAGLGASAALKVPQQHAAAHAARVEDNDVDRDG
jgi:hypothetical protein